MELSGVEYKRMMLNVGLADTWAIYTSGNNADRSSVGEPVTRFATTSHARSRSCLRSAAPSVCLIANCLSKSLAGLCLSGAFSLDLGPGMYCIAALGVILLSRWIWPIASCCPRDDSRSSVTLLCAHGNVSTRERQSRSHIVQPAQDSGVSGYPLDRLDHHAYPSCLFPEGRTLILGFKILGRLLKRAFRSESCALPSLESLSGRAAITTCRLRLDDARRWKPGPRETRGAPPLWQRDATDAGLQNALAGCSNDGTQKAREIMRGGAPVCVCARACALTHCSVIRLTPPLVEALATGRTFLRRCARLKLTPDKLVGAGSVVGDFCHHIRCQLIMSASLPP